VHLLPLKTLTGRKYSFQKLTQFSKGNNVLGAEPSNIDGFLLRDTYVSSTHLNMPICNKMSDSSLFKDHIQDVFLSKTK
jgi:hypothetical protein